MRIPQISTWDSWTTTLIVALALVLIPFLLFEDHVLAWSKHALEAEQSELLLALLITLLLASDTILPIPSSLVSIAAATLLSASLSIISIMLGMTAGCILGYRIGRRIATAQVWKKKGGALRFSDRIWHKIGIGCLVVFRPIPVLAEVSIMLAGARRTPYILFLIVTTLSNLAIAVAYTLARTTIANWMAR